MKLLITNARVIDPSRGYDEKIDILIENGKLASFGEFDVADRIIDASGLIAAPGLVDMHVHLRDPGQTHKEDILRLRSIVPINVLSSPLGISSNNSA